MKNKILLEKNGFHNGKIEDKKKLNVGFDIGIASVGWSLIDENNKIVDLGVRLFEDPANSKDGTLGNESRRNHRSQRRRISRRRTRKNSVIGFCIDHKLVNDEDQAFDIIQANASKYSSYINPLEIKYNALTKKITDAELVIILFHYAHHRGFSYITSEMLKEMGDIDKALNSFPTEQLYDFYKKNGYYDGAKLNQKFGIIHYEPEIREVLRIQEKSQSFIEEYIKIWKSIRDYSQGPGSEKSPTPYGLFVLKDGKVIKDGNNLWDRTIGKCTIYPDVNRGLKNSPIAEIFNILNDLNNLYFYSDKTNKLTIDNKQKIFKVIQDSWVQKQKKKTIDLKMICKIEDGMIGNKGETVTLDAVFGYRKDAKNSPNFTQPNNYFAIVRFLLDNKFVQANEVNLLDINFLQKCNDLFEIIAKQNDFLSRSAILKENTSAYKSANDDSIKKLLGSTGLSGLTQSHSFSYKAMLEYIPIGIEKSDNQQVVFAGRNCNVDKKLSNLKYIPKGIYKDSIISPTTKRALLQSINVMNKIIKLYANKYDLNNITFELPRDKNTAEQRKSITKIQNNKENFFKEFMEKNNLDISKMSSSLRLKIALWDEQDAHDYYDGNNLIDLKHLINYPNEYDVDHIIPYSISFIDSRRNKILTKKYLNHEKSNLTPYQWLTSKGKYEEYKKLISLSRFSKQKKELLLYEGDPVTDLSGFIEKNLADTRYASSEVFNLMNQFLKQNQERYPNAKVKVINGAMTNFVRYNLLKLNKNRDEYLHHAVDATIVNFLGNNNKINKLCTKGYMLMKHERLENGKINIYDPETGEKLTLSDNVAEDLNEGNIAASIKKQIVDKIEKKEIKYSRQIVTYKNIGLSKETINSVMWNKDETDKGNLISKIDLLDTKTTNIELAKYFDKDERTLHEKLFVWLHDKQMYEKLAKIYDSYVKLDSKKNVFLQFMKDQYNEDEPRNIKIDNQFIRKLKVKGNEVDKSNLIILQHHSDKAVLSTLNSIAIRIYKDRNDKYIALPINQKVLAFEKSILNTLIIDQEKLSAVLKSKNIENKDFIEINNGSIFVDKVSNDLFFSNKGGNFNQNKIEIKCLFATNLVYFKEKQKNIAISTIIKNYDIAEVDVLGNIYNRRPIVL